MERQRLPEKLVKQCKSKLLETKMDLLNRVKENRKNFSVQMDTSGDEADQSVRIMEENDSVLKQERLRETLMEIEMALGRIENGTYGICEETEEVIEPDRLIAIPWTRLSIEGAEVRESLQKRFAYR
jgi:DnaK suppressor protein